MRSRWAEAAQDFIAKAHEDLGADATLADRRGRLRAVAEEFHSGTSWGKKVWSVECRKYLEQHGLPPLYKPIESSPLFADDITFPFRQDGVGK